MAVKVLTKSPDIIKYETGSNRLLVCIITLSLLRRRIYFVRVKVFGTATSFREIIVIGITILIVKCRVSRLRPSATLVNYYDNNILLSYSNIIKLITTMSCRAKQWDREFTRWTNVFNARDVFDSGGLLRKYRNKTSTTGNRQSKLLFEGYSFCIYTCDDRCLQSSCDYETI